MLYYEKLEHIKGEIVNYVNEIFKVYGNELLLRLEDYNLLSDKNNCIESSTAPGFIIEEFIVSKLNIYSQNHSGDKIMIKRIDKSTVDSSYDCYSDFMGTRVLINIKSEKTTNNAISAVNKLYNDYVICDSDIEKAFLVLKINYTFRQSSKDFQNKIFIENVTAFFIEEIDFSGGHKQDNRNWSKNFNPNSGRLQISKSYIENNKTKKEDISYENTKKQIEEIYTNNNKIK